MYRLKPTKDRLKTKDNVFRCFNGLYTGCGSGTLEFWIRPHSAAHAFGVACAVDSAVRVRESMIESGYLRYRSPGSCSGTNIRTPIEAEYRIYRFLSGPPVVASERLEQWRSQPKMSGWVRNYGLYQPLRGWGLGRGA